MAQLEAGRLPGGEHTAIEFLHVAPVRLRQEFRQTAAHHGLAPVLTKLPVHELHAQVFIHQEQPVGRVLRHRAQNRVGLPHSLLGQLAGRDVIRGAEDTGDSTGLGISHRQRTNIQPLALAVNRMNPRLARLRFAAQNANVAPCNDGLPFLIDQRIPTALHLLERAAEDGLHTLAGPDRLGLALRVVAVLKHVHRRHRRHGSIAKLTLPQSFLRVDPAGDLHEETNHPRGPAARIPFRNTTAIEHPTPTAVFVAPPILGLVELLATGDDILDLALDARSIFRVNPLVPEGPGAITRLRDHAEDAVIRLGVPGFAARQVPVPHAAARTFQRRLEAALTADVFEFRLLALLDIHANADHSQCHAVGIALDNTTALKQPAPAAFAVPNAILRIVVISLADDVITEAGRRRRDIIRVDVGIPAGDMIHTFAGMQVQPGTPIAVPAGALGTEIQLPQAHPGAPDSGFQPRLAGTQLALGTLLRIDIARDTDCGSGLALEIPGNRAPAGQHPFPLTVGGANAILGFDGRALAAQMFANLQLHGGAVVRMNAGGPRDLHTFTLLPGVAGHRKPQRAHDSDVSRDVPLPESRACAP